jgi:dynein heavy chain
MIVGQSGVGKSTIYRLLKQTMHAMIEKDPEIISKKLYHVEEKIINPKSVTMGELYGEIDVLSQEWTDGLMSSIIRECNNC